MTIDVNIRGVFKVICYLHFISSGVAGKMRGTLPRHHSCLNPWHIHVYSLLSPSYIPRIKTHPHHAGYPPLWPPTSGYLSCPCALKFNICSLIPFCIAGTIILDIVSPQSLAWKRRATARLCSLMSQVLVSSEKASDTSQIITNFLCKSFDPLPQLKATCRLHAKEPICW